MRYRLLLFLSSHPFHHAFIKDDDGTPMTYSQDPYEVARLLEGMKLTNDSACSKLPSSEVSKNAKVPLPRYETLQESLEIGRTLLQERNMHKIIKGILGALYGECGMSVRTGVCLTVLMQDIATSIVSATSIVILVQRTSSLLSLVRESGRDYVSSILCRGTASTFLHL